MTTPLQEEVAALFNGEAFKLTDGEKAQLLEVLPSLKDWLGEIEHLCTMYLFLRLFSEMQPSNPEMRKMINGHKQEPGLLAKLKTSLAASQALLQLHISNH